MSRKRGMSGIFATIVLVCGCQLGCSGCNSSVTPIPGKAATKLKTAGTVQRSASGMRFFDVTTERSAKNKWPQPTASDSRRWHSNRPEFEPLLVRDTVPETNHGSVCPRQITLRSSTFAPTSSAGTPDRAFAFALLQKDPGRDCGARIAEETSRASSLDKSTLADKLCSRLMN